VDYYDDQFDFHTYSPRRMTLRSYIDLIKTEDRIRAHPFYKSAALEAAELYVNLHDHSSLSKLESDADLGNSSTTKL
jgi:peptide alpha-N-acetyltransferase